MIKPTIGRRVWYWPNDYDFSKEDSADPFSGGDRAQPCDAGIAYVWNDRMINITVADHSGKMHARTSVRLLQGDDKPMPGEPYAQWMPYQATHGDKKVPATRLPASWFSDGYETIEQEIQAKGLTAPRITSDAIEANIFSEHYFTAEHGVRGCALIVDGDGYENVVIPQPLLLLTFCVLVLKNGFTVTGGMLRGVELLVDQVAVHPGMVL